MAFDTNFKVPNLLPHPHASVATTVLVTKGKLHNSPLTFRQTYRQAQATFLMHHTQAHIVKNPLIRCHKQTETIHNLRRHCAQACASAWHLRMCEGRRSYFLFGSLGGLDGTVRCLCAAQ
jgi:hypothetical protein